MRDFGVGVMAYMCIVAFPLVTNADGSSQLARLVQRHEAGAGLVATLTCNYKLYDSRAKCALLHSGTYYRDSRGEANLPAAGNPGGTVKVVVADGVMSIKARPPAGAAQAWIFSYSPVDPSGNSLTDIWVRCLFRVPFLVGANSYTVREYCDRERSNLSSVTSVKIDGNSYTVVTFQSALNERDSLVQGKDEIWFDEGRNFLVAKCVRSVGESYRKWEVDRFTMPAPGVYFPTQISERGHKDQVDFQCVTVMLSDVRVNDKIPDAVFDASVPASAEVLDFVSGRQYKTDATGKQLGEAKTFARIPAIPNPPAVSRSAEDAPPPTTEESRPWSRFAMPVGLGLLLAGSTLWFVRRWRQRRAAS